MKLNLRAHSRWALALLALLAFCSLAVARDLDQDEALQLRQQGVILPLEQLLQQALDLHPGAKLLEAELEEKHGVYIYEVELLDTEGVVRELDLEAATGRLLKDKED
ncbi:PepSY domain-containing protein [Pseudomonas brassicacearum]|uniref:PepSY domain-containing protein n=1 Tax=Pseudomonas brassicacearum TaxID=930166 RepID=UPI000722DDEA|nr:PepSY domain-containing protein [Pseudomonas brassicacearum]ALQ04763.1 Phosphonate ABC transporter phosphate-binding periplasmic component [Pseudomonas brassicacearum]